MLRATGIIWTVDKHSIVSTLYWGGGAGEQFVMKFANRPSIFGQDCSFVQDFSSDKFRLKFLNRGSPTPSINQPLLHSVDYERPSLWVACFEGYPLHGQNEEVPCQGPSRHKVCFCGYWATTAYHEHQRTAPWMQHVCEQSKHGSQNCLLWRKVGLVVVIVFLSQIPSFYVAHFCFLIPS